MEHSAVVEKKYKLSILSDCPIDKVDAIRKNLDLGIFDLVYFSSEKHMLKDNDNFFLAHLHELGVKAAECLYLDDQEKYVKTAKHLGMQGLVYEKGLNLDTYL